MWSAPAVAVAALIGMAAAEHVTLHLPSIALGGAGAAGGFQLCVVAGQQNCVIDGDTIRYGGMRIRLEDIDAPETHSPKCASEAALGRRATLRLLELMNAGPFQVIYTGGRDTDIYGRKLRVLQRNGRSLGGMLVAESLARYWDGARRSWCG
jgi:endonuclease YncB( thermonuclease family)